MAMVTITGNTIRGATASKDNRTWQIRAVAYQYGGTGGGVITPGADWETLYPVDGVLTFTAEAGSVVDIKTPDAVPYRVRIPTSDAGLWDTIEAGVAYQPDAAQDNLNRAVAKAAPGFIAAELGQQTADAITTDLDARRIGFVDEGEGAGHFTITSPDGSVVDISGTLVPPAATWSGVAGAPDITYVSRFVPLHETYEDAIEAAIAEAAEKPTSIVDFEGVNYETTATVTVSDESVILQNGGITPSGEFPALSVTGADVTVRNMVFDRASTAPFDASVPDRNCVVVAAERFRSVDCTYLGADLACVYLTGGECDGAVIQGGRMTGARVRQSGCGIYCAPAAAGNRDITVQDVLIHDTTDGVLLFDTGFSRIQGCRVQGLRKLPVLTLTGWTHVSGNIYRQRSATGTNPGVDGPVDDRDDGPSVVLFNNGSQMTQGGGASPGANQWDRSGGYVYINLDGTNPSTRTITSLIVSGYAYTVYMTSESAGSPELMSNNRIVDNYAEDIDGFGIYVQLSNNSGAFGNHVIGNTLKNVCLEGTQTASLPFSGVGVVGGNDTLLAHNTIDGVGSEGKTAPGIAAWPGVSSTNQSGKIIGCTVRNGLNYGIAVKGSGWTVSDSHARDNSLAGFYIGTQTVDANVTGVCLLNCSSKGNSEGLFVDGTLNTIGYVSVSIIGGAYYENTNRGIYIAGSGSGGVHTKGCIVSGVLLYDNGGSTVPQVYVNGLVDRTVVENCVMLSATSGAKGIDVTALPTETVVCNNRYDLTTPETFAATVKTIDRARGIYDTSGNMILGFMPAGSANYIAVRNTGTGVAAQIRVEGSDTDRSLMLITGGDGTIIDKNSYPLGTKVPVPDTATSPGTPGQWACNSTHIYFCNAGDQWVRASAAAW